MSDDRTVHGFGADPNGDEYEVVRYNRAGKWRLEYPDGRSRALSLATAVESTHTPWFGRRGGLAFDAAWKRANR